MLGIVPLHLTYDVLSAFVSLWAPSYVWCARGAEKVDSASTTYARKRLLEPLIMHVFHVCWPGQLKLATLLNITEGSCSCLPLPVMMMVMAIY